MNNKSRVKRVIRFLSVGATLVLMAGTVQAATMVGNDAIDRASADGWSEFVLGLTSETFTAAGTVTDWQVYAANTGTLGMLLLRNTGGNDYQVVGVDNETITTAGLNNFAFTPDSGSAQVQAGDILGLYIGSAKVDFDLPDSSDSVNWCSGTGCASGGVDAGATVSLTGGPQNRTYSANVTLSEVPLPAAAWLFGSALVGFMGVSRRKRV